jgi:trigger factor
MQVKKTDVNPTQVKLVIVLTAKELDPVKAQAVQRLGKDIKIAGFRPGKAPVNVIEKNLDANILQSDVMEEAINQAYAQVLAEENMRPVAHPNVSITKFVPYTDLEFEMTVDVVGKVTLPDYKKIKKTPTKVTLTASDVDEVLKSVANQMAEKKDVSRAAKNDDIVFLDFAGTDDKGVAVQGAEAKEYPLTLGSNAFIPGFEENIVGLKANDHKEFTLTFPKDYGVKALASKKVTFKVDIIKVQESAAPKIDDEMAKKAGPFKDLAALKADIKTQLTAERQTQADREFENALVQEITAKSKVAVPEALITEQLEQGEQEERQNLAYKGQTWEEHLKEEGVTEEEHRKRNRDPAEERVKAGLVLSQIAEEEKLDVNDEEVALRIELLKGQYQDPAMRAELDKPENRRNVAMRILTEKTLEKLTAYATKK